MGQGISIPLAASADTAGSSARPQSLQLIFLILTIVGMLLIAVSVLSLLSGKSERTLPNACLYLAETQPV